MAKDFGEELQAVVHTDSTAAMGIVHRQGVGRTRHIDVQFLWIQEKIRNKKFAVAKVDTKKNVADLMTKYLSADVMNTHMSSMDMHYKGGRSKSAPSLKAVSGAKAERKETYEKLARRTFQERQASKSQNQKAMCENGIEKNNKGDDIVHKRGGCDCFTFV